MDLALAKAALSLGHLNGPLKDIFIAASDRATHGVSDEQIAQNLWDHRRILRVSEPLCHFVVITPEIVPSCCR
jgi:hypothetical protein